MPKATASPLSSNASPSAAYDGPTSTVVLICGPPGSGKTSSISPPGSQGLPVDKTFVFTDQPLPFRNHRKFLKADHINSSRDWIGITSKMKSLALEDSPILYPIIDDFDYILAGIMMNRIKESGWDKWNDVANAGYQIIQRAMRMRSDQIVFIMAHDEVDKRDRAVMKTFGNLLREKLEPEGYVQIVLWSQVDENPETGKMEFTLRTQPDGRTLAKSPAGMFTEPNIPNDLAYVVERIEAFYAEG